MEKTETEWIYVHIYTHIYIYKKGTESLYYTPETNQPYSLT